MERCEEECVGESFGDYDCDEKESEQEEARLMQRSSSPMAASLSLLALPTFDQMQ